MKKSLSALLCVLVLATYSCSKKQLADDNNHPVPNDVPASNWDWPGTPPFSMKVNNSVFVTDGAMVISDEGGNTINVNAADMAGNKFVLQLSKNIEADHEYKVPEGQYGGFYYLNMQTGERFAVTMGAYKILHMNSNEMDGMFFGTLKNSKDATIKDSIVITEGYFRVKRR